MSYYAAIVGRQFMVATGTVLVDRGRATRSMTSKGNKTAKSNLGTNTTSTDRSFTAADSQ